MTAIPDKQDRQQRQGALVLVRHGETEWSRLGRHTGRTDLDLTERGVQLGAQAGQLLAGRVFSLVLTSPLLRAHRTAQLAGLVDAEVDDDLMEWDYGGYEGMTAVEIRERAGDSWKIFDNGVIPGATSGESLDEVAARCHRVIGRATPFLDSGDVVLVGHGHCLRILAAMFLGQDPRFGSQVLLDAGSVSSLRWDRQIPVIETWNRTVQ